MNTYSKILIALAIVVAIAWMSLLSFGQLDKSSDEDASFGGEVGPVRDVFGLTVNTSTEPVTFFANEEVSDIASTSVVLVLTDRIDEGTLMVSTPNASSTSELYWKIWGSSDYSCDATATSTEDDSYVSGDPYVSDINWFTIPSTTDTDGSGNLQNMNTFGKNSATGTAYLLSNLNWDCLRFEASGASTTVSMRFREKIN